MVSTVVTTSATTRDVPRTVDRPGVELVYEAPSNENVVYSVETHPPTPRDKPTK